MTPDGWSFALKSSDNDDAANQVILDFLGSIFNLLNQVAKHATRRPSRTELRVRANRPFLTSEQHAVDQW